MKESPAFPLAPAYVLGIAFAASLVLTGACGSTKTAARMPSPTPTPAVTPGALAPGATPLPVATPASASRYDRSPGVLYEEHRAPAPTSSVPTPLPPRIRTTPTPTPSH